MAFWNAPLDIEDHAADAARAALQIKDCLAPLNAELAADLRILVRERLVAGDSDQQILDYLQHQLPGYPFQPELDVDYVEELLDDFPDIDILAQIKAFRWYYNNRPFRSVKKPRVALRRWLANAWPSD